MLVNTTRGLMGSWPRLLLGVVFAVLALAGSLIINFWVWPGEILDDVRGEGLMRLGWNDRVFAGALVAMIIIAPYLWTLSAAGVATALMGGTTARSALVSQPGGLATLLGFIAATLSVVLELAGMIAAEQFAHRFPSPYTRLRPSWIDIPPGYIAGFDVMPGAAVAGAWLTLAITGQWRPVPTLADRLGRSIGVGWITFALLSFVQRLNNWIAW